MYVFTPYVFTSSYSICFYIIIRVLYIITVVFTSWSVFKSSYYLYYFNTFIVSLKIHHHRIFWQVSLNVFTPYVFTTSYICFYIIIIVLHIITISFTPWSVFTSSNYVFTFIIQWYIFLHHQCVSFSIIIVWFSIIVCFSIIFVIFSFIVCFSIKIVLFFFLSSSYVN